MPDGSIASVARQQRAYSTLVLKSVDEDQRIITGIASTPDTDRMGDVVESKGARFKLPLPLLWQHNADQPIGHVISAKVESNGISIKAQIAKGVLPFIEDAWSLIKAGLVQGLSIGFRPLEYEPINPREPFGAYRYITWDWYELSAVTIPANASASIQTIKTADQAIRRAALGAQGERPVVRLTSPPGASGHKPKEPEMKTYAEQIRAFEEKRAATAARCEAVQQQVNAENRSKTEEEREEFKNLTAEISAIDQELIDLRLMEKLALNVARPVDNKQTVQVPDTQTRSTPVITDVRPPKLEKGQEFGRWALAMAQAKGNINEANAIVQNRWKDSRLAQMSKLCASVGTSDLFEHFGETKSAVAAGDHNTSGWASQLAYAQNIESEFVEFLRPKTVIGRVDALVPFRRVPFNFRTGTMTAGTTASWVGAGYPIPVTKGTTSSDSLGITKIAGMSAYTEELLRLSSPSIELVVRDDLAEACAYLADTTFLDPNNGGVANITPASITYAATVTTSAGSSYANFVTDVKAVFAPFISANQGIGEGVWVGSETLALALSLSQNSLGQSQYPGMTPNGGTLLGRPFVASQAAYISGSPDYGNQLVLIYPRQIWLADDGSASIDVSNQTAIQMDNAPTNQSTGSTTATSMVSMFQTASIAVRAIRPINWKARGNRVAAGVIRTTAYA